MLRFMGSQRVGYDWATELNQTAGHNVQIKSVEAKEVCPIDLNCTVHPSQVIDMLSNSE